MVHGAENPKIRVPHRVYELLEDARLAGFMDMARENHDRGFVMLEGHLLHEADRTGDRRYRELLDWLKKHKQEFFFGVSYGFEDGR
ncbi:MAG TPA: hypothetical protein VMB35_04360 [Methanomicrobiales archaeon]|nr:hypothetical protein [Methanomicrobiales archaeon]